MNALLLTLVVGVTLAACGGSPSPTSPTPTPTPTPAPTPAPTGASSNWVVTQRFASVTGPDNCWVNQQRARLTGLTFPGLPMTVTRADSSITFTGSFFQVNYAGTASGTDFSATGSKPLDGGGGQCVDGTSFPQLPGESRLLGSFSSDTLLIASEVNTYALASGGTVIYTWEWQATRVN